ncbi:complement decay-accelerating factor, GPI-anchored-like isoform X2 [Erythrolamprus reginae]|uniref:complement decay-accelerating factor, GPI-anchored-like isoform X2 n=1 Tax=Erythrolamprus reginae TaxID=121349 RepID=UPI00396CDCD0
MMALSCNQARLLVWMLLLLNLSEVQSQCPTPVLPPYSSLREGTLKYSYPVGTVLWLNCIAGYEPISGTIDIIMCRFSNQWSGLPTLCQGRQCPVPRFDNGRIIDSVDLRLGEEITLGCDYGFRLIGENTRRCVLRGGTVDWNKELPFCERIPCTHPPVIPNGRYDASPSDSYNASWEVTYRCDADYTLIGNSTITCVVAKNGVDEEWNWPSPECKKSLEVRLDIIEKKLDQMLHILQLTGYSKTIRNNDN